MKIPFSVGIAALSAISMSRCGDPHSNLTPRPMHAWNSSHTIELTPAYVAPPKTSESSRRNSKFAMTKELPDVTRRLINTLNTCWLQAGVKEMELDLYSKLQEPLAISVEHIFTATLRDRFFRIVQGESLKTADLQAGGDMNEVRVLVQDNGLVPEQFWKQPDQDWGTVMRELTPVAEDFREKYRSAQRNSSPRVGVLKDAKVAFQQFLEERKITAPTEFKFRRQSYTPKNFADRWFPENPHDFVLFVPHLEYVQDISKEFMGTKQDIFVTDFESLEKTIRHEIDHDRSVLTNIWWPHKVLVEKGGNLKLKKQDYSENSDGHVINITGYHLGESGTIDRLKFENTWGEDAGSHGFYTISWQDFGYIADSVSVYQGYSLVKTLSLFGKTIRD